MKAEAWIAVYAAVVATSALLLNFRSWWESGPRLHLSLMVDGVVIGIDQESEEKNLVILTVTNRGREPTVITHMVVFRMDNWYQRLRLRPSESYLIPNPQLKGFPPIIPGDLESAKKWTGVLRSRPDMLPDLLNGKYFVGVYASHRDRPYLKLIPPKKDKLPEKTVALE